MPARRDVRLLLPRTFLFLSFSLVLLLPSLLPFICVVIFRCVLCNECYQASNHPSHEVYFYHSQAGGCCDCGDSEAWAPEGFCASHGKRENFDPVEDIPRPLRESAEVLFDSLVEFLCSYAAFYCKSLHHSIELFHARESETEELYDVLIHGEGIVTGSEFMSRLLRVLGLLLPHPNRFTSTPTAHYQPQLDSLRRDGYLVVHSGDPASCLRPLRVLQSNQISGLILTTAQRHQIQRALAVVIWLTYLCETSDGLCKLLCYAFTVSRVTALMSADCELPTTLQLAIHKLLITLMADQDFKMNVAISYAKAYHIVAASYAKSTSSSETSLFHLSVQFLNRETFVMEIVTKYAFFHQITNSLQDMLQQFNTPPSPPPSISHSILLYRRYTPLIGDLKIAFSTVGMSRIYCGSSCFTVFLSLLLTYQGMNQQVRAITNHVEYESREWLPAFNLDVLFII